MSKAQHEFITSIKLLICISTRDTVLEDEDNHVLKAILQKGRNYKHCQTFFLPNNMQLSVSMCMHTHRETHFHLSQKQLQMQYKQKEHFNVKKKVAI